MVVVNIIIITQKGAPNINLFVITIILCHTELLLAINTACMSVNMLQLLIEHIIIVLQWDKS